MVLVLHTPSHTTACPCIQTTVITIVIDIYNITNVLMYLCINYITM